jgi:hypothetical protein
MVLYRFLVGYGQPPAASGLGVPCGRHREPSTVGVGSIHGRENLAFGFGFERFDARSGCQCPAPSLPVRLAVTLPDLRA